MHRCGPAVLFSLALAFVLALTGCLGKSSGNAGNGGVESVTLSPSSTLSIDVGSTQVFSASGKNAKGGAVLGVNIQYVVESGSAVGSAPLSVASNGSACAGTWDINVAICSPGTSGIAYVTAVINGVSSPPTTVYVHQHVDSIKISNAESQQPQHDCFSQGQTWIYQATAYSNNVDITTSVGPMSWSSSNVGVVTPVAYVPTGDPTTLNQVKTTAKSPGITRLFASVAGTTSAAFSYTTCLVSYIRLQIGAQAGAGNSTTVNTGGSIPVTATVVDTLGFVLDPAPLTWSTTNPEVAAFSSVTTTTSNSNNATARSNPGGTTLFASCSPPSCNIGVPHSAPVYSSDGLLPSSQTLAYGSISVDVTLSSNTKEPTYTAWAATTGCAGAPGCSSALFSVTTGNTALGQIVSLPRTPNSMMFNHASSPRIYFGTDQGLMYVDVTASSPSATLISNATTPCNVSLCGTVLTISNDGKQVVVSDPPASPTPGQIYIYTAGSTSAPVDLIFSDPTETATAASFSPDQSKLFILTKLGNGGGNMYVYSTVDALGVLSLPTPGTQALFSADGSFAYVPNTAGDITAYSTCSQPPNPNPTPASVAIGSVAATSAPWALFASPVLPPGSDGITQSLIAFEPPNVELLTATNFTQVQLPYTNPYFQCQIPTLQSFTKGQSYNLGETNTPLFAQLVNDGTELVIIEQNVPAVLLFNTSEGTTTSIPLSRQGYGSSYPLVVGDPQQGISPATASPDGSQVFVEACDQYEKDGKTCAVASVHVVYTTGQGSFGQGDIEQIPYVNTSDDNNTNMCNAGGNGSAPVCLPNLIAIRPQ
jgi:hypothetical protein